MCTQLTEPTAGPFLCEVPSKCGDDVDDGTYLARGHLPNSIFKCIYAAVYVWTNLLTHLLTYCIIICLQPSQH